MDEAQILKQELEHYKTEKERVRKIIGQIGGNTTRKQDRLINIIFLTLVSILFLFDFSRELFDLNIHGIPSILSIELAVLLVSLKIIWMINKQSRVDHFQFWILNSIEFQINLISKRMREIEGKLDSQPEKK